ncbi:MAG: hypothetical protein JXR58_07615 [Bacteroidales bacterium]|nr:hypothetical protein [Bacteroidales bacterium]
MKKAAIVILVLLISFCSFSQIESDSIPEKHLEKNKNYLGFNLGSTTGIGFSYIRYFGKFGTQFTFMPGFSAALGFHYDIPVGKGETLLIYNGWHYLSGFVSTGLGMGFEFGEEKMKFRFLFGYALYGLDPGFTFFPLALELGYFYNF